MIDPLISGSKSTVKRTLNFVFEEENRHFRICAKEHNAVMCVYEMSKYKQSFFTTESLVDLVLEWEEHLLVIY